MHYHSCRGVCWHHVGLVGWCTSNGSITSTTIGVSVVEINESAIGFNVRYTVRSCLVIKVREVRRSGTLDLWGTLSRPKPALQGDWCPQHEAG